MAGSWMLQDAARLRQRACVNSMTLIVSLHTIAALVSLLN